MKIMLPIIKPLAAIFCVFATNSAVFAADAPNVDDWRRSVVAYVEEAQDVDDANAMAIGRFAELGYREHRSTALLQDRLREAGFDVESGVIGMPTAFIATYGKGGPVIGLMAEFDALAGFSQSSASSRQPVEGQDTGHACGHNLLGSGAVLSAVAIKRWLVANDHKGTIMVFGTPAEEGGGAKVYFAGAGSFDQVDVMLNWHPDSFNASMTMKNLSMIGGKFRFYGASAHASAAPEKGRSALDGVEAMNVMANMMREHMGEKSRLHYAITATNPAPNVVPDYAEVFYYVRAPDPLDAHALWMRLQKAAEGAALGTETRVESEIISGLYGYLPNSRLAAISHSNLQYVGGVEYDEQEVAFATEISTTFLDTAPALNGAWEVSPFEPAPTAVWMGSSDVGDVSWVVPTNWIRTATYVPGTAPHSWQAVAASNMSIGLKGMHVAAKVLALTAVELLQNPVSVSEIRAEFEERRGKGFRYKSLIGDREPPLDYTK